MQQQGGRSRGELLLPEGFKRVNDADFQTCMGLTKVTSKTTDVLMLSGRSFGNCNNITEYDFSSLADTARMEITTSSYKYQSTLCGAVRGVLFGKICGGE